MMGQNRSTRYKLIKIYKIEAADVAHEISQIKERLINFINWSSIDDATKTQQHFLLLPTEPIYNEGVHVSYKHKTNLYEFQLIKADKSYPHFTNCFYYQYQFSIFYDDPLPVLKPMGYIHNMRRAQRVTIFKSLKYGIEVVISQRLNKDSSEKASMQNEENKGKAKIEVIETSSLPISPENSMITKIDNLFQGIVILPTQPELSHEHLTLKGFEGIEIYNGAERKH